ncbi:unnamed protein product [Urochloa humidicola]
MLDDDDGMPVTEKDDVESDEALWALYARWCKAFNKDREHAGMARTNGTSTLLKIRKKMRYENGEGKKSVLPP